WAILGDGHLLIEDVPGLAKTLIAKSFAAGLGLSFRRIQFTPDLLPADITGTYVYDRKTSDFVLRRGPIFTQLLLADEINRAPPRTQSALLEAMQERQATLEGETFPLERPFFVIATQNPIEHEGTYPLPEAQVDRFLLRIDVGYPTREQEVEVLERRRKRRSDDATIEPVTTPVSSGLGAASMGLLLLGLVIRSWQVLLLALPPMIVLALGSLAPPPRPRIVGLRSLSADRTDAGREVDVELVVRNEGPSLD